MIGVITVIDSNGTARFFVADDQPLSESIDDALKFESASEAKLNLVQVKANWELNEDIVGVLVL